MGKNCIFEYVGSARIPKAYWYDMIITVFAAFKVLRGPDGPRIFV